MTLRLTKSIIFPHCAHWVTDGQHVGHVLIRCNSLGQVPGRLGCTQNYRRTFQPSTELVGWSSLMSGLLGIQQKQLGVGSKRPAHLIEEDFAWKSSKFSFPEHFTTRHGFHSKKTFAEKTSSTHTSTSELLP